MDDRAPPSPDALDRLLPEAAREAIPALYATEHTDDPIVHVKLFTPWTHWTWFITEFDGEDTCFGLVDGYEAELGYFSLSELLGITGPAGLAVERDLHFSAKPMSAVRADLIPPPEPPAPQ